MLDNHIFTRDIRKKGMSEDFLGTEVGGIYYLKSSTYYSQSGKNSYYVATLSDKTGEITAKIPERFYEKSFEGSNVKIEAVISLFRNAPQLEVFAISQYSIRNTTEEKMEAEAAGLADQLVCQLDHDSIIAIQKELSSAIRRMDEDYQSMILSVYRKEPVWAMSRVPASADGAFAYNGGVLERANMYMRYADAVSSVTLPGTVYDAVLPDYDVIRASLLLGSLAGVGSVRAFPDGTENALTGGMNFLPRVLNSIAEAADSVDRENIIHCIRCMLFGVDALTFEAEVVMQIVSLTDTLAVYSHAVFQGKEYVKGHRIREV